MMVSYALMVLPNSLEYHFFPGQRVNRTECHKRKNLLYTTEEDPYKKAFLVFVEFLD